MKTTKAKALGIGQRGQMTPKQVLFGNLTFGQEFKMSHQGSTYIKTRLVGYGLTKRNARAKDDPNMKIFIQSTTGVIIQS